MTLDVQIRWLIRRDMPDVLRIENASFAHPWTDNDFVDCLVKRNCIGNVVEHGHEIIGFMLYELYKNRLDILKLAVDPAWRRRGVGASMIQRLIDKLSQQRRNEIRLHVAERNLPAQMFYRRMGFQWISTAASYYRDGQDAYLMRYWLDRSQATANPYAPVNRISAYLSGEST